MELIFGGLKNLLSSVLSWLRVSASIPYDLSFGVLILLTAAFFLLLFSGLAAAEIAERRGHAPHLHLVLGCILPGLYPLVLPLVLKPETGSEVQVEQLKKQKERERASAKARAEEEALREKQAELAREESDPGYWPRDRVERIRLKSDGTEAGPFVVRLKEGRELAVNRIPGTTPGQAMLELSGADGKTSVLRIPFEKIEEIRAAE